jgi:hypothetical protein
VEVTVAVAVELVILAYWDRYVPSVKRERSKGWSLLKTEKKCRALASIKV